MSLWMTTQTAIGFVSPKPNSCSLGNGTSSLAYPLPFQPLCSLRTPPAGMGPKSHQSGLSFLGALFCILLETFIWREIRPNLKLSNTQIRISKMLQIHLFIQQTFISHFLCYLSTVLGMGVIYSNEQS